MKIAVIGGGASGLMAAIAAARNGAQVTVYEKMNRVGKKILATGNGRCNFTNVNADISCYNGNNPKFALSALSVFSADDTIRFFEELGIEHKVEESGKVFPMSDQASSILDVLLYELNRIGVNIICNTNVKDILKRGNKFIIRADGGKKYTAEKVILAPGGKAMPSSGSDGEGYELAKKLGHTVTPLKPSLVPLVTAEKWIDMLQGLALKNVSITVTDIKGRKIYSDFGEMLFTHFGVSGPVILSASRHILPYDYKNVRLSIDLKPALDEETLDARIRRDFEKYSRKQFKNSLDDLLPKKMIPVVVMLSGIDPEKPVNQITKAERRELLMVLKNFKLEITGARPISEAIVTAGGICTDEINPSTMESKLVKGLYFAGEVIDVDGYTGGFNLTIAFSTGYLAGMNC